MSYRDVEELLAERGIDVDHVPVYRWAQRLTPLLPGDSIHRTRPRHVTSASSRLDACHVTLNATDPGSRGGRWKRICPAGTSPGSYLTVNVAGQRRYLYRAVDQYGQVIDVLLCEQRDTAAARRFFTRALRHSPAPVEVTTDKAGPHLRVLDNLVPAAAHSTAQYDNNPIESDHARLKARLRPMRGLTRFRSAEVIAGGHAFVQNLRRGHYELASDAPPGNSIHRARAGDVTSASSRPDPCPVTLDATKPLKVAFAELALAV